MISHMHCSPESLETLLQLPQGSCMNCAGKSQASEWAWRGLPQHAPQRERLPRLNQTE